MIGEAAMQKYGNLGAALGSCSKSCLEGCTHGVIEEYMVGKNKDDLVKNITSICALPDLADKAHEDCIHGIGHGLLAHNGLPSPMLSPRANNSRRAHYPMNVSTE